MQMTKLVYIIILLCSFNFLINCQRLRNGVSKAPNCLGLLSTLSTANEVDGRFTLELENGPRFDYEPFEKYSIILKSNDINTHFKEFNIIAEPDDKNRTNPNSKIDVGRFERYKEALTKYSEDCPNGVQQSSLLPKQGIKVKWIAPASGSGCVRFRAAARNLDQWITNQNTMSFVVCEEGQLLDGQPKILSRCTACDEAKYGIEIIGLWSRNTHPVDYPKNAWDAAFTDFIGASHSNFFHIFSKDELATEPLRRLAEDGQTKYLIQLMNERDIKPNIRTIIKARGITHPLLNGKTFAEFRVDRDHHLMSLVAKLEPSPDWFIGVDSLELCTRNGSWIDEKQMNLYLWDAGTDGGNAYENANKFPLKFREKIYQLTNLHPQNSPFYNLNDSKIKPFARIRVVKQRVFPSKQPCRLIEAPEEEEEPDDSLERNFVYGESENIASIPPYGRLPSSLRPGYERESGYDEMNRYNRPDYNSNNNGYDNNNYDNMGDTNNDQDNFGREINSKEVGDPSSCATSEYGEWSECELLPTNPSPNCGDGKSKRRRELLNPSNLESCSFVILEDEKFCEIPCETNLNYQTGNREGFFSRGDSESNGRRDRYGNRFRNNRPDSFAINKDSLVNRKNYDDLDDSNRDDQNRPDNYDGTSEDTYNNNQPNYENTGDTYDNTNNEDYRNQYEPSTSREPYEEEPYRIPENCKITDWTDWSSCFGDCSTLRYRNRTRSLITFESNCLGIQLNEQEQCTEECGTSNNNYNNRGGYAGGRNRQRTRIMPRNVTPKFNLNNRMLNKNFRSDNRSPRLNNNKNILRNRLENKPESIKLNSRNTRLNIRRNTNQQKRINQRNDNTELLSVK